MVRNVAIDSGDLGFLVRLVELVGWGSSRTDVDRGFFHRSMHCLLQRKCFRHGTTVPVLAPPALITQKARSSPASAALATLPGYPHRNFARSAVTFCSVGNVAGLPQQNVTALLAKFRGDWSERIDTHLNVSMKTLQYQTMRWQDGENSHWQRAGGSGHSAVPTDGFR
jgi:hypothetical protein